MRKGTITGSTGSFSSRGKCVGECEGGDDGGFWSEAGGVVVGVFTCIEFTTQGTRSGRLSVDVDKDGEGGEGD